MSAALTTDEVSFVLATMLADMSEYTAIGDRINESRQKLALGLGFQAGEERSYLVGRMVVEVKRNDKGEYTFLPKVVEG